MEMPISMRHRQHFLLVRYSERDNAVRAGKPPTAIEEDERLKQFSENVPKMPLDELRRKDPKAFMDYARKLHSEKGSSERQDSSPSHQKSVSQQVMEASEKSHPPNDGAEKRSFTMKQMVKSREKEAPPIQRSHTDAEALKKKEASLPPGVRAALEKLREKEAALAESNETKPGLNMDPNRPVKKEIPKELQDLLNRKHPK